MVLCDAIERESKKANAVLFGLLVTDANDLDEHQRQHELVVELNQHRSSSETNLYIDFRKNCIGTQRHRSRNGPNTFYTSQLQSRSM
uniref:Uncharacterized protein n=1 Tax=Romanomermis culicivorax TaxID=13658 RepID=A0A915KTB9_ROMCU